MPLSICHFIQSLDPKAGGPPVIAWELAKAQRRRGQVVRMGAVEGIRDGIATKDGEWTAAGGDVAAPMLPHGAVVVRPKRPRAARDEFEVRDRAVRLEPAPRPHVPRRRQRYQRPRAGRDDDRDEGDAPKKAGSRGLGRCVAHLSDSIMGLAR